MPKPRKKSKHVTVEHNLDAPAARDESSPRKDLVGQFLASVAIALVTALISQATAHQINWGIVVLAFLVSLGALIAYQKLS